MKTTGFGKRALLGALAIALIGASPSNAQVSCGDDIVTDTKLTSDLHCNTEPALRLVGPAKLDLNGHTISCQDPELQVGIRVEGQGGALSDGTVRGCLFGVLVTDGGGHKISGVVAEDNVDDGFQVWTSENKLKNNTAVSNGSDGFAVPGSGNRLKRNTASFNIGDGFDVTGDLVVLARNVARSNQDDGFWVYGTLSKVKKNLADSNDDDGIDLEGDEGTIQGNTCTDNSEAGIEVETWATGNLIKKNTALDNLEYDLRDKHGHCDENVWKKNTFDTSDPGCIQ